MGQNRKRNKRLWVTEDERKTFKAIQKQTDAAEMPIFSVKHGWTKTKEQSILYQKVDL